MSSSGPGQDLPRSWTAINSSGPQTQHHEAQTHAQQDSGSLNVTATPSNGDSVRQNLASMVGLESEHDASNGNTSSYRAQATVHHDDQALVPSGSDSGDFQDPMESGSDPMESDSDPMNQAGPSDHSQPPPGRIQSLTEAREKLAQLSTQRNGKPKPVDDFPNTVPELQALVARLIAAMRSTHRLMDKKGSQSNAAIYILKRTEDELEIVAWHELHRIHEAQAGLYNLPPWVLNTRVVINDKFSNFSERFEAVIDTLKTSKSTCQKVFLGYINSTGCRLAINPGKVIEDKKQEIKIHKHLSLQKQELKTTITEETKMSLLAKAGLRSRRRTKAEIIEEEQKSVQEAAGAKETSKKRANANINEDQEKSVQEAAVVRKSSKKRAKEDTSEDEQESLQKAAGVKRSSKKRTKLPS